MSPILGLLLRDLERRGMRPRQMPFAGKRTDKETFYAYTSFISPTTIYRYDPATGKSSIFRQPKVDFDASQYETKQVFYNSKDGTRVPMFLTYKKGLKLNGQNPTLLYGYGGFDISLTPSFSIPNVVWLEMGGIYAQPNLRGGKHATWRIECGLRWIAGKDISTPGRGEQPRIHGGDYLCKSAGWGEPHCQCTSGSPQSRR